MVVCFTDSFAGIYWGQFALYETFFFKKNTITIFYHITK